VGEAERAGRRPAEATARPGRFTNLIVLDSVDSTNRYAADAARDGAAEGLVVVAGHQLAGRGRRGRTWLAPPGGALLCSIVFRPALDLADLHVLGPLVGLAALDAVAETAGLVARLKWPNDLVVGERKLAGVLAELVEPPTASAHAAVVVGIGLNLSWTAGFKALLTDDGSALGERATTVEEATGTSPSRDALLDELTSALERRYAALERGGARSLMADYRAACSTIGRLVEITTPLGSFVGRATSVADDGRLAVATAAGEVLVDSADVVHLRDAS